ncbi:MAG: TonB family protein [Puniceicoccaceae bacterium 5H]|nr:MAG: TonB family protein [Puniceicoccaceae bacterium 5H]
MKTSLIRFTAALLGLVFATGPAVQLQAQENYEPPKILKRASLNYPEYLTGQGIMEGTVLIQVETDPEGNVEDWLTLSATHDGFVRHLTRSIAQWRFTPATQNGEPVYGALLIEVRFEYNSVASLTTGEMASAFINHITNLDQRMRSRVANISQLDKMPEPVHIVEPAGYSGDADAGAGDAVVSFYIDEEGKVRMPVVTELNCDLNLAASAYDAVRQWRFEPPTVKGKPMIVRAEQRFVFKPTE